MKKEIEIVAKKTEIYKIKLLMFMAIAGGSWVYILKFDNIYFIVLLLSVFITSVIGIFNNISKLSQLENILERIQND